MFGYVIVGMLAAFGALSVLWAMLGWLLPGGKGCALVCCGAPDVGILARAKWLKSLGLLNIPLLAVMEADGIVYPGTEICSREELLPRLEQERRQGNGTGDADHPGCSQCRGVSEL